MVSIPELLGILNRPVCSMKCSRGLATRILFLVAGCCAQAAGQGPEPTQPGGVSYSREIWPILQRNCQGCHQPALKKGLLDVTSYQAFAAGGMSGAVFVPLHPAESLVVAHLTGDQQPRMPVEQDPLSDDEIDLFRRWIEQGALDDTPAGLGQRPPGSEPPVYRRPPVVTAVAYSRDGARLAVSGYREVLLHAADGSGLEARLPGLSDRIQSLSFLPGGQTLMASGGTPARFGEVQFWDLPSGKLKNSVTVCHDTVFGTSVSPDGSKVALGCSDKTVRVLEAATGRQLLRASHHEDWVLGTSMISNCQVRQGSPSVLWRAPLNMNRVPRDFSIVVVNGKHDQTSMSCIGPGKGRHRRLSLG